MTLASPLCLNPWYPPPFGQAGTAVLQDWTASHHIVHIVDPAPRGVLPSVRSLIDYLVIHVRESPKTEYLTSGAGIWNPSARSRGTIGYPTFSTGSRRDLLGLPGDLGLVTGVRY